MRILIKLYGYLKRYAPDGRNQFTLILSPGATLGDVHDMLAISGDAHVSLINGRRAHREAQVEEGDTLVLFPPITGG